MTKLARWGAATLAETARNVRADAGFYLAILLYTTLGLLLLQWTGADDRATYGVYFARWAVVFGLFFPLVALIADGAMVVHRFDRRRKLAFSRAFSQKRVAWLLAGTALLMAFVLFQGTFTSLKNTMVYWQGGFLHDRVQADIDKWLHFGVDPWRLLFAFGENDLTRTVVEWNYNVLWFVLCFGALFFVVTSPRAIEVRGRYLACFMLVWIVCGNIFAVMFISAGPAFYGAVTGDEARFAEQLAFLAQGAANPNSAVAYQDYLWSLHEAGATSFGSGISAFPSIHVGLVALNAIFITEYSRRLGLLAWAYLGFIVASSVYLAWHYAIDGYASIVLVAIIHYAVKAMARREKEAAGTEPAPSPAPGATLTAS